MSAGYIQKSHYHYVRHGSWLGVSRGVFRLQGYQGLYRERVRKVVALRFVTRENSSGDRESRKRHVFYGLDNQKPLHMHLTLMPQKLTQSGQK